MLENIVFMFSDELFTTLESGSEQFLVSLFTIFGGKTIRVMLADRHQILPLNQDNVTVLISHRCIQVGVVMVTLLGF